MYQVLSERGFSPLVVLPADVIVIDNFVFTNEPTRLPYARCGLHDKRVIIGQAIISKPRPLWSQSPSPFHSVYFLSIEWELAQMEFCLFSGKGCREGFRNTWTTFLSPPTPKPKRPSQEWDLHRVSGETGSCSRQEPAFLFSWLAHTFFVFVYLWLVWQIKGLLFLASSLGRSELWDLVEGVKDWKCLGLENFQVYGAEGILVDFGDKHVWMTASRITLPESHATLLSQNFVPHPSSRSFTAVVSSPGECWPVNEPVSTELLRDNRLLYPGCQAETLE